MKRFLTLFIFVYLFFSCFVLAADKVEINTASLEQLDEITGVGPVLAQRIVDARPFSSVDDLIKVKGIGEKTLQKIKDQGLAYVGEKSEIQNPKSETNLNPQNLNNQNAVEEIIVETPKTYQTGVVLNEILPSSKGADEENEWIELYNTNNSEIDLSGWKIKDTTGTTTTFIIPKYLPDGKQAKISAYDYLVFKRPDTKITLNNTNDGLTFYWPDGTIIDSMTYEKAPINQSYNKIGVNWQWGASLTPGAKNIVENLFKIEKSDNSEEVDGGLAAIGLAEENTNPWFLFLVALAITIFSIIVVLFIKFKIRPIK